MDNHGAELLKLALSSDSIEHRLAYADWLEPRGNPLGELIRLACAHRIECDPLSHCVLEAKTDCRYKSDVPCGSCPGTNKCRAVVLRAELLSQMLSAVEKIWPACVECKGTGIEASNPNHYYCKPCHGVGRVGQLYRDCPKCKGAGSYLGVLCTTCDSFGQLLDMPCKRCVGGKFAKAGTKVKCVDDGEGGTWEGYVESDCQDCNTTGRVESPIVPIWQLLVLTYSPDANKFRCGNIAKYIKQYLKLG